MSQKNSRATCTTIESKKPVIPTAIMEYFEQICQEYTPRPSEDIKEIMFKAGARDFVRRIRNIYDKQSII